MLPVIAESVVAGATISTLVGLALRNRKQGWRKVRRQGWVAEPEMAEPELAGPLSAAEAPAAETIGRQLIRLDQALLAEQPAVPEISETEASAKPV